MQSLELNVGGMGCGGCVEKLSKALGSVPGVQVQRVAVGSAAVAFDPAKTSRERVIEAVTRAGFTASEAGEAKRRGGHGACCTN